MDDSPESGHRVRILIITAFPPPPEGIGRHSADLGAAWVRLGHEVRVLAPGNEGGEVRIGEQGLLVTRSLGMRHAMASRCVIDDFLPDLVLCQFSIAALTTSVNAAVRACHQARALGARVVISLHEPTSELRMLGPAGRWVYRRTIRAADEIVVFSREAAAAAGRLGVASSIRVLPLGIPAARRVEPEDLKRVRDLYAITGDTVLALGFVISYKGTDVLVAAGDSIAARRSRPTRILIAGEPRKRRGLFRLFGLADERHHRALLDAARRLGPGVSADFSSFVPDHDLPALLASVSILAMPYRHVAQSGVATWALAAGLPVVASDLPGLREGLGDAAVYVAPDDPLALADGICSVLDDEDRRAAMARSAQTLAGAQSFEIVAAAISDSTAG